MRKAVTIEIVIDVAPGQPIWEEISRSLATLLHVIRREPRFPSDDSGGGSFTAVYSGEEVAHIDIRDIYVKPKLKLVKH